VRTSIYGKMVLGFGVIILVLVLVNGSILFQLREFSDTVRLMLATDARTIDAARQARTLLAEEEGNARKLLVTGDTLYRALFADVASLSRPLIDSVLPSVSVPREQQALRAIAASHRTLYDAIMNRAAGPHESSTPGLTEAAVVDTIARLQVALDRVITRTRERMNRSMTDLEANTSSALERAAFLTIGALLGTLIVAFLITRTITRPLKALQEGTRHVLEGVHVPIRVSSRDEIAGLAEDFNDMSERLKRSTEQRTEMMQQISHEIRNPLQSMYAAYYLLSQQIAGPLTDEQRTVVGNIKNNIDRISDFSTHFLDLAKIEAGVMPFNPETVNLASVITPAVQSAQLIARERNITLTMEAEDAPPVTVDPGKIEQVATNFLTNALKYTPEGGTITVRIGPSRLGTKFSVTDTGVGIPPEDLPRLFTKFFQAKNSGQTGKKGTGLGLALVRAIVEQHGGTVTAESVLGSGSTFAADFPPAAAPPEAVS
jgi:two-component system, NtrC family, sensor histidine kinase GlrK